MVSVCLPFDALWHLPSYLGFSYLGRGVSLTAAPPDLERGVAPLALLRLCSRCSLDAQALLGRRAWPWAWDSSSQRTSRSVAAAALLQSIRKIFFFFLLIFIYLTSVKYQEERKKKFSQWNHETSRVRYVPIFKMFKMLRNVMEIYEL